METAKVATPHHEVKNGFEDGRFSRSDLLEQLERIVRSKHFRNSKRYPTFLRFVVEQTLAGKIEGLKERTLGVDVFARPNHYDTNEDPIVRVTAGEIRKRIAQYYQEPGHEREIKLLLPSGSYVPQFYPPEIAIPPVSEETDLSDVRHIAIAEPFERGRSLKLYAGLLLVLAVGAALVWRASRPTPIEEFWAPFFKSPDPILF